MKPMLAGTAGKNIRLPAMVSPKLDGIRCLVIDGVAVGRSLKPIPSKFVQEYYGRKQLNGLDGELIVGQSTAPDVFHRTSSGVMSVEGDPNVEFFVFDNILANGGFGKRFKTVQGRIRKYGHLGIRAVVHHAVETIDQVKAWEKHYLAEGFEGLMLRDPDGPYKHGRSTTREGWLLKLKRFTDAEARILGARELMHNMNKAERNELGYLERSSHKSGKVESGLLGALLVEDILTGVQFEIGTGFTRDQRAQLWEMADLVGRVVKYKSQPTGVKDKPRFPVFLGFRDPIDT